MATLDATLGGEESNSYVTVAWADTYADNTSYADDWSGYTDDEKALALIQATKWLETLNYRGERCADDDGDVVQRLKWPRKNVTCDGMEAVCTLIPYEIQAAEVELALQFAAATTNPITGGGGVTTPDGVYVKRQKLDVLEVEYAEYSNAVSSSCDTCGDPEIIQRYPWLKDLLGCWAVITSGSNKMVRLFRN